MTETKGNKLVFFLGIQRQPLGPKVRPGGWFWTNTDWDKLWRDQVPGPGIQRQRLAPNARPWAAGFGAELQATDAATAAPHAKMTETKIGKSLVLPEALTGRSRGGHRKCSGGQLRLTVARQHGKANFVFSRDSEAAFGTQSATMGGLFWIRIRLGKAVAGPGVRGQDDRDKWKQTCFFLGIQRQRLAPKVRPWEARWGGSGPR